VVSARLAALPHTPGRCAFLHLRSLFPGFYNVSGWTCCTLLSRSVRFQYSVLFGGWFSLLYDHFHTVNNWPLCALLARRGWITLRRAGSAYMPCCTATRGMVYDGSLHRHPTRCRFNALLCRQFAACNTHCTGALTNVHVSGIHSDIGQHVSLRSSTWHHFCSILLHLSANATL